MKVASRFSVVVLTAFISVLASAALAFGAPLAWDSVDVTVHEEQGTAIMLVSGTLPEATKLPAQVELSVPAGAQFQWAGEILGGPPSEDPSATYEKRSENGLDIYSFKLTQSHIGQLEVIPVGLVTSAPDGLAANLVWTPTIDVRELRLNYRLPQSAKVLAPAAGATVEPGQSGFSYYTRTVGDVAAGQTESLAFTYSAAITPSSTTAPSSGSDTLALVLVLGVAVVFFVVFGLSISRKMQAKSGAAVESPSAPRPAGLRQPATAAARASQTQASAAVEATAADRPNRKPVLMLGLVVGVLGLVAIFALNTGGKAAVAGDTITLTVAQVDACSSASIPLVVPEGGDLKRDANDILGRLKSVPGVGTATIHVSQSRVEVAFCQSSADEATIRAALAPSGYVAPAAQDAAPQQPDTEPGDQS